MRRNGVVRRWGSKSDDFNINKEYLSTSNQYSANSDIFKIKKHPTVKFKSDYELLKLEDICYISKGMVVHANEKLAKGLFKLNDLLSHNLDKFHPKPFVEGKDLDKWSASSHKWLEWGTTRAPSLFSRPTFPELYNHNNKLLLAKVGSIRAVIDSKKFYCNEGVYVCLPWHYLKGTCNNSIKRVTRYKHETPVRLDLPKREALEDNSKDFNIKYLLAVINSKVAANFLDSTRRNNVQLYPDDWKKLPIPKAGVKQQNEIAKLVDEILLLRQDNLTQDVSAIESEIDDRVAALYGL